MEDDLPLYRAFLIDGTGRIFAVRVLICANDASALQLAAKINAPCAAIEVWNRTILVGQVSPRNRIA
jgi:hypothetical protein